ncbi:MAG: hypothetical protein LUQ69_02505 [Methanoregulaceae archaeon]|jgi:hypothetical protein|nr:hypothetical protein [Methanoregulaceae archaeon]
MTPGFFKLYAAYVSPFWDGARIICEYAYPFRDPTAQRDCMADENGQFEQGKWITGENPCGDVKKPEMLMNEPENSIDKRITELSKDLNRNIEEIFQLTRDLLTTEAGHRHIEQLIGNVSSDLERKVSNLFQNSADQENEGHEFTDKSSKNDI